MQNKEAAFSFLFSLEEYLNKLLPEPAEVSRRIRRIVEKAKVPQPKQPHLKRPEEAFLNTYIAPGIHQFLSEKIDLGDESAKKALLSENYRHIPGLAGGTPARSKQHPFTKVMSAKPQDIIEQWKGNGPGQRVVQSCPDMALRPPCPHKVIIEGKFFTKGGLRAAETSLATNIYQTFFYRALPFIESTPKHAAWDYDYACFLAYDATEEGNLLAAWNSLDKMVRRGCWDGANIYVMILRGSSQ